MILGYGKIFNDADKKINSRRRMADFLVGPLPKEAYIHSLFFS